MQAVRSEGTYADGLVCLRPQPEEVYGTEAAIDVRLRRLLDGRVVLQEAELAEYNTTEVHRKVGCQSRPIHMAQACRWA